MRRTREEACLTGLSLILTDSRSKEADQLLVNTNSIAMKLNLKTILIWTFICKWPPQKSICKIECSIWQLGKKKKALMFQIITKFQYSQISPKGPPYDSYLNPTPPNLVIHISMINKQLYWLEQGDPSRLSWYANRVSNDTWKTITDQPCNVGLQDPTLLAVLKIDMRLMMIRTKLATWDLLSLLFFFFFFRSVTTVQQENIFQRSARDINFMFKKVSYWKQTQPNL